MLIYETRRRLLRRLAREYGRESEVNYSPGDMDLIGEFHRYIRERREGEYVDGITYYDLDGDRLFKMLNSTQSTPGEEYLYHILHAPAMTEREFARRRAFISFAEEDEEGRLKAQYILARLGRFRRADVERVFNPGVHRGMLLGVYILLALAFALSPLLAVFFGARGLLLTLALFSFNAMLREVTLRRVQADFDAVNFSVSMALAVKKLKKLGSPRLDALLGEAYEALGRMRPLLRTGGVSRSGGSDAGDLLSSLFLLDLIMYEYMKTQLGGLGGELLTVFESLGSLDAFIAVASYRRRAERCCDPEIDYSGDARGAVGRGLVHPLLRSAVPNGLDGGRCVLITGSNASGKSTYLRTAMIAALLSQCICTCPGESWRGEPFRLYTSMALSDDVLSGESYYMAEIRAVKRILDAAERPGARIFCVLDEVLRGTNTTERIAAACEILAEIERRGCLCLAATHDAELCALLAGRFSLLHFEEHIEGGEMAFDYRARPGRSETRNAIKLLSLMGLGDALTARADARARRFLETGAWTEKEKDK